MSISFNKIGINKYQLEKLPGMEAEAVFYANDKILPAVTKDLSLNQLAEAAMLPKLVSPVIGLPDIHQGFGLPIGGVMATDGLISAGAVGMDINCGIRLLTSKLKYKPQVFSRQKLQTLIHQMEKLIPTGLGGKHRQRQNLNLCQVVQKGVEYLVKQSYAYRADLECIEEGGKMEQASFEALSEKAKKRAVKQLGTLGSGNHFIEIQKVEKIFDEGIAQKWGLFENQICLMIHTGSRALGHQTCLDHTNIFWKAEEKYGIKAPRKGLAALPIETPEGSVYFSAMAGCVNFAFCNRAMISYFIRQVFKKNFGQELELLYDVAHNIAKWEEHERHEKKTGKTRKILVHRKGATRALPAGHPKNPKKYKDTGHPAIVPGSMGTPSFVMVGLEKNKETFNSINHGAGRVMSRRQAKKTIQKETFQKQMANIVYNKPFYVISDEAPDAYKNIVEVIDTLVKAGLTKKVAKLVPLAVIKGD